MAPRTRTPSRWLSTPPGDRPPLVSLLRARPRGRDPLHRRELQLARCLDLWGPSAPLAGARALATVPWRRPPDAWRGGEPPLASFADHLLRVVRYPLPAFVYPLLDGPDGPLAAAVLATAGAGEGLRSVRGLPPLSRRAAHLLWTAPAGEALWATVRRAQLADAPEELVRAILRSAYGRATADEALTARHLELLARHAGELGDVGVLVDWLATRRDVPCSIARARREAEAWHRAVPHRAWSGTGPLPRSGLAGAQFDDVTVRELDTVEALVAEGAALAHCVATYVSWVRAGRSSLWSLRRAGARLLTLEVWNVERAVVQIRGRANRRATREELAWVDRWAAAARLEVRDRVTG